MNLASRWRLLFNYISANVSPCYFTNQMRILSPKVIFQQKTIHCYMIILLVIIINFTKFVMSHNCVLLLFLQNIISKQEQLI